MTNAVCGYDFTVSCEFCDDVEAVKSYLKQVAKKWTFQKEKGQSGYLHFQGRLSLKVKKRINELKANFPIHWSITSSSNTGNMFYVSKEDTREAGPWSDTDREVYIPVQYRQFVNSLLPFQKTILDMPVDWRTINLIVDTIGNNGKSVTASIGELCYNGVDLPFCNDGNMLVQTVCDILHGSEERHPGAFFLDLPRAIPKVHMAGFFTACEQIKKGKVWDCRYKYKSWWFDSPNMFVFTNEIPDLSYLSHDRWKLWEINEAKELVPYVEPPDPLDILE
ncbi:MAG: replication-associated protein [Cressdnaviricota sp.]|nr:MAG: replication-associated protein [Cressdnaviricota sp.]